MKRWFTILLVAVTAAGCMAQLPPVVKWDVETGTMNPQPKPLSLVRGESVYLQPRLLTYGGVPLSIATGSVVELRIATGSGYATNPIVGSVLGETGRVSCYFGPWIEPSNTVTSYEIAISGTTLRARGTLTMLAGVGDPGGGVWPTGQPSATAYALLNPRVSELEATVSGIGTGSIDAVARAGVTSLQTGKIDRVETNGWEIGTHAGLYPRNNPSNYTTAADITAATGTLGTASRSYADAAVTAGTGAVATALRADIVAATNPLASRDWVEAQGYGTGGGGSGTFDHVALTNQNGSTNFLHLTAAERAIATTPYILPTNLQAVTFAVATDADNTNLLVLAHGSPGGGQNMSGSYPWSPVSETYCINPAVAEIYLYNGQYIAIGSAGDACWTNSANAYTGTYYPSYGTAYGTITAAFAKQSASSFADADGLHGNGEDLTLSAAQIATAGGLTNNQPLPASVLTGILPAGVLGTSTVRTVGGLITTGDVQALNVKGLSTLVWSNANRSVSVDGSGFIFTIDGTNLLLRVN